MTNIRQGCANLVHNHVFELAITAVIIINSLLIGVETYVGSPVITAIQTAILYIFTFEILVRFIAAGTLKEFFSSGWNIFDLTLVLIGWVPETLFENSSLLMGLRVLRVFRVLRLLRSAKELKLIVTVLVESMTSMFYNLLLFLIFVYLFGIVGVSLFRMPNPDTLTPQEKIRYEQYIAEAPNAPGNAPDPYGSLGESIFTLFRALTGEDWTDLRYNLITAHEYGLIRANSLIITTYHVTWFCLSAFLLLNLVTGAVINNYQVAIQKREEEEAIANLIEEKEHKTDK